MTEQARPAPQTQDAACLAQRIAELTQQAEQQGTEIVLLTESVFRHERRAERERKARKEAEQLLHDKSSELFESLQTTREGKDRLKLALWASGEGIWSWQADTDLVTIDQLLLNGEPVDVPPATSEQLRMALHRDDVIGYFMAWSLVVNGDRGDIDASCRCRWSGEWRWIRVRGRPVEMTENGRALRIVGTIKDITEQRQAEQSLRLMAQAFASTHDAMAIVDQEWRIVEGNTALARMMVLDAKDLAGQSLKDWMDLPVQKPEGSRRWQGELVLDNRRELVAVNMVAEVVDTLETKGRYTVVALQDARERKQAREVLLRLANTDALTQLPNRIAIEKRLDEVLMQGKAAALIFIDLDGFKLVNDSAGHEVGDEVLREVASRLRTAIQPPYFVGRWGGDEFIVVMPDVQSEEHVHALGSAILAHCRQTIRTKDREVAVGASLGAALAPRDGLDSATLLRRADAAMYMAKEAGRDRLEFFQIRLERDVMRRAELINQLRMDAEHDGFRFEVQTVVNRGGFIVGGEMLMRWNTPQHGVVSPVEFIPLVEQAGLMPRVGQFALHRAVLAAKTLKTRGETAFVAVNLSALQLRDARLCEHLLKLCKEMGVEPQRLDLELTESAYVHEMKTAAPLLHKLSEAGFCLSLDDFGTGYSAMSQLRDLPFNKVKIDRTFVQDITHSTRARRLFEGIVHLCDTLGMKTVAEGVETEEQYCLLYELGVDMFQGWHLGRPTDFDAWPKTFDLSPQPPLNYPRKKSRSSSPQSTS